VAGHVGGDTEGVGDGSEHAARHTGGEIAILSAAARLSHALEAAIAVVDEIGGGEPVDLEAGGAAEGVDDSAHDPASRRGGREGARARGVLGGVNAAVDVGPFDERGETARIERVAERYGAR